MASLGFIHFDICQCVSEWAVKCEDRRRHSGIHHRPSIHPLLVPIHPRWAADAKSNRLHSQPRWTHISTCKYAKRLTFKNTFSFNICVFFLLTICGEPWGVQCTCVRWLVTFATFLSLLVTLSCFSYRPASSPVQT